MSVDIVDLGSGNIRSIKNALRELNVASTAVRHPNEITSNTLILPGVGSAGPYMDKMVKTGFDEAVKAHGKSGKNLIGICLGFQLMTRSSDENGGVAGLGLLDADTRKVTSAGNQMASTHNGWEAFSFNKSVLAAEGYRSDNTLTRQRVIRGRVFYNHEYGVVSDKDCGTCFAIEHDHFGKYTAMIIKGNIVGMQFHPEKSQATGLKLLSMLV